MWHPGRAGTASGHTVEGTAMVGAHHAGHRRGVGGRPSRPAWLDQVVRQHAIGGAWRPSHCSTRRSAACGSRRSRREHPLRSADLHLLRLRRPSPGARNTGGWQIKQTVGELSADETQWLVSGIRTALPPRLEPLPDYPSPQQLDAAPRRLAYRRRTDGEVRGGGYWHTVPAGTDSTGRPGNVFTHVLLDRTPDVVGSLRPIQRWRSSSWLRPYGPVAVGDAVLPPDPPGDGQAVTKDSVVAFALDTSTWRLGTLLGLLDAVAAALAGGPPVILGVTSVDSAAQWIGLVSFLMSSGTAATLNFSTFDRADQLGPALEAGQHLSAVPVTDLGRAAHRGSRHR